MCPQPLCHPLCHQMPNFCGPPLFSFSGIYFSMLSKGGHHRCSKIHIASLPGRFKKLKIKIKPKLDIRSQNPGSMSPSPYRISVREYPLYNRLWLLENIAWILANRRELSNSFCKIYIFHYKTVARIFSDRREKIWCVIGDGRRRKTETLYILRSKISHLSPDIRTTVFFFPLFLWKKYF